MPSDNRAPTRTLVRWNDDLDKSILLFMVSTAQEAGIKLPYRRMAELMGPKFSEGAIIQHIAKVRTKMFEEKKTNPELLVPGPAKRGSIAKPASAAYSSGKKRKANDVAETQPTSFTKTSNKVQGRKMKHESDEDDYDQDSEWSTQIQKKKSKKVTRSTIKRDPDSPEPTPNYIKFEVKEEENLPNSATASPRLMSTRGIRQDYREIADGGASEFNDSGSEADEEEKQVTGSLEADDLEVSQQSSTPVKSFNAKTPAPLIANNSGAAFMPAIGSNYTPFDNFNQGNVMLQPTFDPTSYVNPNDLVTGPNFGIDMFSSPIAGDFGTMNSPFTNYDPGMWTPNSIITPASTRNNSTASSAGIPTPIATPAAQRPDVINFDDFNFGDVNFDVGLTTDELNNLAALGEEFSFDDAFST